MLDIKFIRENPELVRKGSQDKNCEIDVDSILGPDQKRRELISQVETLKAERNKVSTEIPKRKKAGEPVEEIFEKMRAVGAKISEIDNEVRELETSIRKNTLTIPNLAHDSVQVGDESANELLREWGEIRKFDFDPQTHWEIGEKLGVLDLEAGAKISGSGFYVLKGAGAKLQRALIAYMLDVHSKDGFEEIAAPHLVNTAAMTGTGQLPKMADDMYKVESEDLWLIPTAEVPVTNLHREEILEHGRLPIQYVAHTPCFRREAGAAGKDTRGMIRVHQFEKVEMVKIVKPSESYRELDGLVAQAEKILQGLKIPYRVVKLATGDLSFASSMTYDLELWAAGVKMWLEISSVSNFEDFQARRMNMRFRNEDGKVEFPHTLNGSGLALARLIPAILENYQNSDGTVTIPEVLRPYLGGQTTIRES